MDEDCTQTFEQLEERLLSIEAKLGERFGFTDNIRMRLFKLDLDNELDEDDLVADWHQAYAMYADILRWMKRNPQ